MKKRYLVPGQKVIIIYDEKMGFVQKDAEFIEYNNITINGVQHQIPVFEAKGKQITGLECFWVLPHDVSNEDDLHRLQYHLLGVQVKALEIGKQLGYNIPQKIKDPELVKMAEENTNRTEAIIKKFGFDPRDESWIEKELPITIKEKKWFIFERENPTIFVHEWARIVESFNQRYNERITVEDAKNLSKKRMRYLLGSYNLRLSGEKDVDVWIKSSQDFERKHRERENRMITWSLAHKDKYPVVRTRQKVRFEAGPYFNKCVEKIPYLFTSANCDWIKEGTPLRVISYDPELKYIKLDFIEETRNQIRETSDRPWDKDGPDYDFLLKPDEIESHLEILDALS